VKDLVEHCPHIAAHAKSGDLVYWLNFKLRVGTSEWNVDLVLGRPPLGVKAKMGSIGIGRMKPSVVQIAVELKAIMTEHHKAAKNRKRDLEAHHEHVHNYGNTTIAGGVFLVNSSATFQSKLRDEKTDHKVPARLVEHCVAELRAVAGRGGSTGYGLEARCAIVVDYSDLPGSVPTYPKRLGPPDGDPLHYDGFIRAICEAYSRRFVGTSSSSHA